MVSPPSRARGRAVGFLSLVPALLLLAVTALILTPGAFGFSGQSESERDAAFSALVGLAVLPGAASLSLAIWFAILVARSNRIGTEEKGALIAALIFATVVALPVIWFTRIRSARQPTMRRE